MAPTTMPREKCPRCKSGKETFHYYRGVYLYDVDRARELTQDGRQPIEVEEESVRESVEECTVDAFHLPHVDPSIPGIIAHIEYRTEEGELVKGHVLIDGHHRAARCLQDGLPFLAYILDEDESRTVLLNDQGRRVERETDAEKSKAAAEIRARYEAKFKRSESLARRAESVLAGPVPQRRHPAPIAVTRSEGPWKWDGDGQRLLDYRMGNGALLMGHAFAPVTQAIRQQLERGIHPGSCEELEVRWAELIRELMPAAERVRFAASGSEAVALACRGARAYTGRAVVMMFDDHEHGWHDEALAHVYDPRSAGFFPGVAKKVVRARSDRPEQALERIAKDDLAAVVLEPGGGMAGALPWDAGFLRDLHTATSQHGTLLVFDESSSGFRHGPGGVQGITGVTPDLTILAKIVSAGLPGAALAGRADVLTVFGNGTSRGMRWAQVPSSGMYQADALSAAAGVALLQAIRDGAAQERAASTSRKLVDAVNRAADDRDLDVFLYTNGTSTFHVLVGAYADDVPRGPSTKVGKLYDDQPDLYALLHRALLVEGVEVPLLRGWVSAAHDDAEALGATIAAYERAFDRLRPIRAFRR